MKRRPDTAPNLYSLRCEVCGSYLERTPSGFLACPLGHGRLVTEEEPPEVDEASLFDPLELETP